MIDSGVVSGTPKHMFTPGKLVVLLDSKVHDDPDIYCGLYDNIENGAHATRHEYGSTLVLPMTGGDTTIENVGSVSCIKQTLTVEGECSVFTANPYNMETILGADAKYALLKNQLGRMEPYTRITGAYNGWTAKAKDVLCVVPVVVKSGMSTHTIEYLPLINPSQADITAIHYILVDNKINEIGGKSLDNALSHVFRIGEVYFPTHENDTKWQVHVTPYKHVNERVVKRARNIEVFFDRLFASNSVNFVRNLYYAYDKKYLLPPKYQNVGWVVKKLALTAAQKKEVTTSLDAADKTAIDALYA